MSNKLELDHYDQELYKKELSQNKGNYPRERLWKEYITKGFIVLDKPVGPTSHDVVATVKKILDLNKAGHSGTLDPAVSGVLPIALEHSTKILSVFSSSQKRYICNLHLKDRIDPKRVEQVIQEMQGQIYQFPPLASNVVRKLRKRTIYKMDLKGNSGSDFLLDIVCEAGTYIRTLCKDMGKILGTRGHMKELRRVTSGGIEEDETITLHQLFDAIQDVRENISEEKLRSIVFPMEEMISHIPSIIIRNNAIQSVVNGAKLAIPGVVGYQNFELNETVRILTVKGEIVALGLSLMNSDLLPTQKNGNLVQPSRVIFNRED